MEQRNFAHDGTRVELLRVNVLSFPECFQRNLLHLECTDDADGIPMRFGPSAIVDGGTTS